MSERQVWRHTKSGEDFIVAVEDDGEVILAAGPLHHADVQIAINQGFDSDPELVEELNEHGEDYVLFWKPS